jgi:LacI family transcriptional regulator
VEGVDYALTTKPTIYDVAQICGLSIATVSKVINNTGSISPKTREKVLRVIKSLEYEPSIVASALMGKSTFTIGLIIPDLANPFFALIARYIEDRGFELGFNIIICSSDYDKQKEKDYVSLFKKKRVDGIILASGFENEAMIQDLVQQGYPVAVTAREVPFVEVDNVSIDNFMAGYKATKHLIELGHERIAIVARDLWSNRERMRGYSEALKEHSLDAYPIFEYAEATSIEGGEKAASMLLAEANRPTAIFACSDLLAIGVIRRARAMGFEVPRDLSVIGFDDTPWATYSDPPLSTIAQPFRELGNKVVDLIVQEIKKEKKTKMKVILTPELVIRESTGSP